MEPDTSITEETREFFREAKKTRKKPTATLTGQQREMFREAGRRGGETTKEKYGKAYFSRIAPRSDFTAEERSLLRSMNVPLDKRLTPEERALLKLKRAERLVLLKLDSINRSIDREKLRDKEGT